MNPSPVPTGYAAPCSTFSLASYSIPQSGTMTGTITPTAGVTQYIYTTGYLYNGSSWLPETIQGSSPYAGYSNIVSTLTLSTSVLTSLPLGTIYVVEWDWTWNSTMQCYLGPGSSVCNQGSWRLQEFGLTAPAASTCFTSTAAWQSEPMASQTGSFTTTFDATPNNASMDGLVGLSQNPASFNTDVAVIVWFSTTGNIQVRNGSAYQADAVVRYTPGLSYHFRLVVSVPTHTYSVYVTPPASAEILLAANYAFRTEQAAAASLNYWSFVSATGSEQACNLSGLTVTPTPTPTPSSSTSPTGCTTGCNQYYVSTTGADSNPGTQSQPWRTIQHAIESFTLGSSGAVIHVAAGTYNQIVSTGGCANAGYPNVNVCIDRGGSSKSVRMALQCDPGAASAAAALGQCKLAGAAYGIQVVANNADIVGFDIGNSSAMSAGIQTTCMPATNGPCATGNSIHIIGNYIHDLGSTAYGPEGTGCPQTGAIGINQHHGGTMTDAQILGNYIARMGLYPFLTCHNTHGIYLNSAGGLLENNVVAQIPTTGIMIATAGCNTVASNNTVLSAQVGITIYGRDASLTGCASGSPGLNTIDNNILVNMSGAKIQLGAPTSQECTGSTPNYWGSNLTDGSGVDWSSGPYFCDTVVPSSFYHESPATTFVSYKADGTGDYHLNSGSAAVNHGTTNCVSGGTSPCVATDDFDSYARPYGSAYDIGAYEWHP